VTAFNPLVATNEELAFEAGSAWRQGCREWYDRVTVPLLARHPAMGIRGLGVVGRVAHGLGLQGPRRGTVAELFVDLPRHRIGEVAWRSAALRLRNRASLALVRRCGIEPLAQLVADRSALLPPALADRGGGLVLVVYHVGAHFGVAAALHRWGRSAFVLPGRPLTDWQLRARALKQAVETVRAGNLVMAAIDGPGGVSTDPVTCLGRRIVLRRGPLMLACVTGAPVLPIVARWTRKGTIAAWVGEPLTAPSGRDRATCERALAEAAAAWLDRHLTMYPEDIWPYTLRNLLGAPNATAPARPH
jgi:hypothetical protein